MLAGIGTDIVDVGRIRRALERWGERFLKRVYTPAEQACCGTKTGVFFYLAGRFAAKEAVLKALGVGRDGVGFNEVEILNDTSGRPLVVLKGRAAAVAQSQGISRVLLSISHDAGSAVAFAVAEKED
ncbi:MAG: holo-[acyl-carrier-protein] synthase [Ammonifex sp.]|nr:MAG: holo-[acyl-carrier-protein] synthase [Ammonifex sp.]